MKVRLRGVVKGMTTAAVVVFGALLIANAAHIAATWNIVSDLRFESLGGAFGIGLLKQHSAMPLGLFVRRESRDFGWSWWRAGDGWIVVPLWAPLIAAVLSMGWAWWPSIYQRVHRPGHCPRCNYDRKGLASGAACPECGRVGDENDRSIE